MLDLLDRSLVLNVCSAGSVKSIEEARTILEPHRSRFLDECCIKPLLRAAEGEIPHVAVSSVYHLTPFFYRINGVTVESGFGLEATISALVKTTTSEIERYVSGVHPTL